MMRAAREWGAWIAATLAVTAIVHMASVTALPSLIMHRTLSAMTRNGRYNRVQYMSRATAQSRTVVRPSPDLLYSGCPYDLAIAHGALHVRADVPPGTYWSVSAFDAQTNNYFVRNDRQTPSGAVDFLIIAPGASVQRNRLPVIVSPTNRGLVLFRTLINDETRAGRDRCRAPTRILRPLRDIRLTFEDPMRHLAFAAFRSFALCAGRSLALCAGLSLALCAGAEAAPTKITFVTDWKAQAEHGGFYEALAEGLYKKAGLDVRILEGGPSVNVPQILAGGAADFGIGSNGFIPLNMVAAGVKVRAVMAVFQKDPQVLIAHQRPDVHSLADMRGKPIMIADASTVAFWPWLKAKYGYSDTQIRKYTFNLAPFLVDSQAIQEGYLTSEPYTIETQGHVKPQVFLLADYGYPGYANMVLVPQKWIDTNPARYRPS